MLKRIQDLTRILTAKDDSVEVCNALSQVEDLKTALTNIMMRLKSMSKCECIGMRLYDDKSNDYPYFLFDGFSNEFIQHENYLCGDHDCMGGNKNECFLECMCGCVLSDDCDKRYPFFTTKGSFWTNDTVKFIENANGVFIDKNKIRGYCVEKGYKSIALIPIKTSGGKIIGLIQFNDTNIDMFTLSMIEYLEILIDMVGLRIQSDLLKGKVLRFEDKLNDVKIQINDMT